MTDIFEKKLPSGEIINKRREISKLLVQKSKNIKDESIAAIAVEDLNMLFRLYDAVFFDNWFKENYKGKLKFSVSRQMTKSAGLTKCPRNINTIKPEELVIEIKIGIDFFFNYGMVEGSGMVGGLATNSSLEALQLVFEHELCHAVEFIGYGRSNCKADRFKTLAGNLFGHTESWHMLPTHRQIAVSKLGINICDTVSFTFNGKSYTGLLYNIKKRAIVMVRDNNGRLTDKQGRRYSKYYVPLSLLE